MERKNKPHLVTAFTSFAVVLSLLLPTFASTPTLIELTASFENDRRSDEIFIEVKANSDASLGGLSIDLDLETNKVVNSLRDKRKSPIIITSDHEISKMILESAIKRLGDRKFYRLDFNAAKDVGAELVIQRLSSEEFIQGEAILLIEDATNFLREDSGFALAVSSFVREAVAANKLRIAGWAEKSAFEIAVEHDTKFSSMIERIELSELAKDPFIGDKISPDLRELINAGEANARVNVIVQTRDIQDLELLIWSSKT